jgi:DNA invertase Pin-like site-specific DNA recombinase
MPRKRGYVRATPRFPIKQQIETLLAAGVTERDIFVEGRGIETWATFIKRLRRGEAVVVDGLHRLGVNRQDIHAALRDVAAKGGIVIDAANGCVPVDARALAAVAEAYRVISGELRIPTATEAKRRGKLGGRPPVLMDKKTKANKRIWMTAKSNPDAERKTGLSTVTMRRWWGPSGRPGGWPSRKN